MKYPVCAECGSDSISINMWVLYNDDSIYNNDIDCEELSKDVCFCHKCEKHVKLIEG